MTLIVPKQLEYLTKTKKIRYKEELLKTVHLLHIVHRFIYQWTFDKDEISLSSNVLQKIYGMKYYLLLEYLIEHGIIQKIGNYSTATGTANRFKLLIPINEVVTFQSTDYVFNKKNREHWERKRNRVDQERSSIPIFIRKKLISDLFLVTIKDFEESMQMITQLITTNTRKYIKNLIGLTTLYDGDIFWKFDDHGRFHSNLTSLMKEIRNNQLLIDGEPIVSLDIKTSQPFFFIKILAKDWMVNNDPEVRQFIQLVKDGDLYNHFTRKYPDRFSDRSSVKPMIFRSFFDEKNYNHIYKELFKMEFPYIYEFIHGYPTTYGESLWKTLQRKESDLIFGQIVYRIINQIPDIKLFTVHDSIHFPVKHYQTVKGIWDRAINEYIIN